jgi:hypothetical protein
MHECEVTCFTLSYTCAGLSYLIAKFAHTTCSATDYRLVVTLLNTLPPSSTFDMYVRLIRSVTMKGISLLMYEILTNAHFSRCALGLQRLFSSSFVQHTLCGIAYKELYSDKGIYQPGTPRKVQNFICILIIHYHINLAGINMYRIILSTALCGTKESNY